MDLCVCCLVFSVSACVSFCKRGIFMLCVPVSDGLGQYIKCDIYSFLRGKMNKFSFSSFVMRPIMSLTTLKTLKSLMTLKPIVFCRQKRSAAKLLKISVCICGKKYV